MEVPSIQIGAEGTVLTVTMPVVWEVATRRSSRLGVLVSAAGHSNPDLGLAAVYRPAGALSEVARLDVIVIVIVVVPCYLYL